MRNFLACTTESTSAPTTENETATETETGAAAGAASGPMASAERAVICGCQIETVHRCSEWVDVDGEWVALVLLRSRRLSLGHSTSRRHLP
ncbi:MAG: hypothetical protein ACYTFV_19120 [Planctomycetota bacterium]|jgi:hypothetical protein